MGPQVRILSSRLFLKVFSLCGKAFFVGGIWVGIFWGCLFGEGEGAGLLVALVSSAGSEISLCLKTRIADYDLRA